MDARGVVHVERLLVATQLQAVRTPDIFCHPDRRAAKRDVVHRGGHVGRDGLTIDDEGRLYALTESGIEVVSPTGQPVGIIPIWCITRRWQNLSFGGPDKQTLYVAGGGTLLRIRMLARGFGGRVK